MNEIGQFCQDYGFPAEAVDTLNDAYTTLQNNEEAWKVLQEQIAVYKNGLDFDYHPMFDALHALQVTTGVHMYTIDLIFMIKMLPILKEYYTAKGYPLRYVEDLSVNLRHYLFDCHKNYGVWGSYIGWWLIAHFKLKCFSIGRLQYKVKGVTEAQASDKFPLVVGQPIMDVHVPPSGPLTPELCQASYDEATKFFREHLGYTETIICVSTWLLSPDLDDLLPPTSNILAFAHKYTLLHTKIDEDYHTLHFMFDIPTLPEDLNDLPERSSLQRALKAHLMAGNKLKTGFGAFRYE